MNRHLRNGSYALIEVKLGGREIDEAAGNLLRLKSKIDTERMKALFFLMVITGTEFAYKREDGVFIRDTHHDFQRGHYVDGYDGIMIRYFC